jgi:hypothetical protein
VGARGKREIEIEREIVSERDANQKVEENCIMKSFLTCILRQI